MLKCFSFGIFSGFSIDFFRIYFFIEKGRLFYWKERKRAEEGPARHLQARCQVTNREEADNYLLCSSPVSQIAIKKRA